MKYIVKHLEKNQGVDIEQWVVLCVRDCVSDNDLLEQIIKQEKNIGTKIKNNALFFTSEAKVRVFLLKWS